LLIQPIATPAVMVIRAAVTVMSKGMLRGGG
jgi:hypothetical protein